MREARKRSQAHFGAVALHPPTGAVTHNPQNRLHNPVTPPYKLGPDAALRQVSRDRK